MVSAVSASAESNTAVGQTTSEKSKSAELKAFSALFSILISQDKSGSVSEEELFAGIARQRIQTLKGDAVATQYEQALTKAKNQLKKPDGFVSYEEASVAALKSLRESGALTDKEADQVYSESFAAAQIDNNTAALWDSRGGKSDPTVAVASMDSALSNAQLMIDKIIAGEKKVDTKSLDSGQVSSTTSGVTGTSTTGSSGLITASGNKIDGTDGFLFKPISNNDGKLAILLPELLAHKVASLVIKDPTGQVLEEGRSTGYGDTGLREKFSFKMPGAKYPDNLHVVATLEDGSTQIWEIPDPAKRYD